TGAAPDVGRRVEGGRLVGLQLGELRALGEAQPSPRLAAIGAGDGTGGPGCGQVGEVGGCAEPPRSREAAEAAPGTSAVAALDRSVRGVGGEDMVGIVGVDDDPSEETAADLVGALLPAAPVVGGGEHADCR